MHAHTNPLLEEWTAPYQVPPFASIEPDHFQPAFEAALTAHEREISAIAAQSAPPDFANTIEALERSGRLLQRVSAVFFNLTGAHTNEALQGIEREIAPRLAKHRSAIYLNAALFKRILAVREASAAQDLSDEQRRLLERYHERFVRAGAALEADAKARMAEIDARLAELGTLFGQNVLADEGSYRLVLDGEADLAGLPEFLCHSAAEAARELEVDGSHVITLARSSIEPFLQFSARRDLRERAFRAWVARGAGGGQTDNHALIGEMLELRRERAALLGFASHADFKLDNRMAGQPAAARDLMMRVWDAARGRARAERDDLQALAASEGADFELAAWDWRFYAERLRKARHDLDEAEIKPYFQLELMIEAAFETAHRLFGLRFEPREDVPTYHPDVRVWEVFDRDGAPIALFLGDYFARPSKYGGAWMSSFRVQERLDGPVRPIIVNVLNFVKGGAGEPTLLSFDDARTLFHEFGHGLHGLLSNVTYPTLAGTNVDGDFVELPSQLYEHWLMTREVLTRFAKHAETGAPIPDALLDRLLAARNFNQGFATVEYLAAALIDLDLHQATAGPEAVAAKTLARIGMPAEIVPRHAPPHFLHLFGGYGYDAGYYSYMWAEVMDADAFGAFEDTGDVFDAGTAERLHRYIYSAGDSLDPTEAYKAFRGRMPSVEALLDKRGLIDARSTGRAA